MFLKKNGYNGPYSMIINVLVESFLKWKEQGENTGYYTLYCDFATIRDAEALYFYKNQQKLEDALELPTGLIIYGAPAQKRYVEDAYYKINIDGSDIEQTGHTSFDSYLITLTHHSKDSNSIVRIRDNDIEKLLDKAESSITRTELENYLHGTSGSNETENEFVQVNNVGQGNWNEYHVGERIPLVYDLGTDKSASCSEVRTLIEKHIPQYESSGGTVAVISHWDLDHYKCLLHMKPNEIRQFACFVVIETLPTATAKKAYDLIKSVPKVEVFAIPSFGKSTCKIPIQLPPVYQGLKLSIYSGVGSNRNSKGLIAVVKNSEYAAILSGDCLWSQFSHIMRSETTTYSNRICHLVVPHHGSGKDDTYNSFVLPSMWHYGEFAISVGKNMFGHPSRGVMSYLKALFAVKKIPRTDKTKQDIRLPMK